MPPKPRRDRDDAAAPAPETAVTDAAAPEAAAPDMVGSAGPDAAPDPAAVWGGELAPEAEAPSAEAPAPGAAPEVPEPDAAFPAAAEDTGGTPVPPAPAEEAPADPLAAVLAELESLGNPYAARNAANDRRIALLAVRERLEAALKRAQGEADEALRQAEMAMSARLERRGALVAELKKLGGEAPGELDPLAGSVSRQRDLHTQCRGDAAVAAMVSTIMFKVESTCAILLDGAK